MFVPFGNVGRYVLVKKYLLLCIVLLVILLSEITYFVKLKVYLYLQCLLCPSFKTAGGRGLQFLCHLWLL